MARELSDQTEQVQRWRTAYNFVWLVHFVTSVKVAKDSAEQMELQKVVQVNPFVLSDETNKVAGQSRWIQP